MSGLAIAFLALSIVLVWGGLAVSLTYLIRHPLPDEEPASPVEPGFGSRQTGRDSTGSARSEGPAGPAGNRTASHE